MAGIGEIFMSIVSNIILTIALGIMWVRNKFQQWGI